MEHPVKRSRLELASWIAGIASAVIAAIMLAQSLSSSQTTPTPTPSPSMQQNTYVENFVQHDSKQPATEEEIQRAAREAEVINLARKKQGI